jgi:hypothetical protein
MTLPLSPQPLPISPLRPGSAPVAFSLVSSLLVPTLPAAKNTRSAVTDLVLVTVPVVFRTSMTTVYRPLAAGRTEVTRCNGDTSTRPVARAFAR